MFEAIKRKPFFLFMTQGSFHSGSFGSFSISKLLIANTDTSTKVKTDLISDQVSNEIKIQRHPRIYELIRVADSANAPEVLHSQAANLRSLITSFVKSWSRSRSKSQDIISFINQKQPQSIAEIEKLASDYLYGSV